MEYNRTCFLGYEPCVLFHGWLTFSRMFHGRIGGKPLSEKVGLVFGRRESNTVLRIRRDRELQLKLIWMAVLSDQNCRTISPFV